MGSGTAPMRGPEWGLVTCNVYILDGMNHVAEQLSNGDDVMCRMNGIMNSYCFFLVNLIIHK